MELPKKYGPGDLALVVWLHRTWAQVEAGEVSLEDAARRSWAMSPEKANRVTILIAVHGGVVRGAWSAGEPQLRLNKSPLVPGQPRRLVSRCTFTLREDSRLAYLVGLESPIDGEGRRNPQATAELRDLPELAQLLKAAPPAPYGVIQIGDYLLSVSESGDAELRMPAGKALTVRTVK